MNMLFRIAIAIVLTSSFTMAAQAQNACANWNNSPKKEDAENAHSIYRQYVKGKRADCTPLLRWALVLPGDVQQRKGCCQEKRICG